ncbi:MAG: hypothetical protein OHK0017_11910 [Patescibacteria group bacterium]
MKPQIKNRIIGLVILFSMLVLAGLGAFIAYNSGGREANASGVTPTITPSVVNVGVAGTITVSFVTTTNLNQGSIVYLTYSSNYAGTLNTLNTTVNSVAPSTVTNSTNSGLTTSVITLANSVSAGSNLTISTTGLTTPVSAGNYPFSVVSSGNDAGGNFQYVGEANVVDVYAFVPVSISFQIRNATDTANTNVCDMNTVPVSNVVSCAYRLKVATNAKNGYVVNVATDGDFMNGSYAANNAAVGPTGTAIAAGTENYGVEVNPGSVTTAGGNATVATVYQVNPGNVVYFANTSDAPLYSTNKPNNPALNGDLINTALVTHKFAISSDTPSGEYRQRVTYIVVPSF